MPSRVATNEIVSGEPSSKSSLSVTLVAPRTGDAQGSADRPDGQADAASAAQVEKVRAELALVKEDLTSAQRESGELRSRVSELERLKGDQERLIGLKDDQIANVLSYVRASWGNTAPEVQPETVAKVRADTAGHNSYWTAAELEKIP